MEFVVPLKVETNRNGSNEEYVFDIFAERYDKWYEKSFGKSAFHLEKSCIESLCENLKQSFLEVGVGTGRFAEALKIEYGIDISAGVLKFAEKREVAVIRGKGEKLPFIDKTFGAVFIIVTLCFVDEPLKVLEETERILRDSGGIILGLILRESPWASFYKKKGLVVVSGCAHAGIINTVLYAQQTTGVTDVHAIMGGFHLAGKECEPRIRQTVEQLKLLDPKFLVPSHCTGWRGIHAVAEALPHAFVWNSVGNLYRF